MIKQEDSPFSFCLQGGTGNETTALTDPSASRSSLGDGADHVGARELGLLTPQQRERLYEEIHGVLDYKEEDPAFVADCLDRMETEILKVRERSAYNRAIFLAPCRFKDPSFRIMFLRATMFDPRLAAKTNREGGKLQIGNQDL